MFKFVLTGAIAASPADLFAEFETKFSKVYASVEERAQRLAIFTENLAQMETVQAADSSATYGHLSPLADMSVEEFTKRNTFGAGVAAAEGPTLPLYDTSDLPESFDWREKGAVNPVKNQGQCGSCWAFATIANIEGTHFAQSNNLVSLSEQELVDCDTVDQGCNGGLPSQALEYLKKNNLGEEAESDYSYTARDGSCQAAKSSEKVFVSAWAVVDGTDEDQLAAALIKHGPLAIGINATPMQWYMGGIADPFSFLCNPKMLDHGVAIVGFGVEGEKKYWIIRNSWGESWGEKGYYRIIRGKGKCGLNTNVATATSDASAIIV
jgi:cathepsin F